MESYRFIIMFSISHFLFYAVAFAVIRVCILSSRKQPAAKKSVKKERNQAGRRGRIEVKTSDDLDETIIF